MGGKTAQTTQQVQIPPEVMQRYRAVNQRAESVASTPFQAYSSDPSAFVAPLNQTQMAGVNNIGMAQNIAQPFYQAGSALTGMGAGSVGRLQPGQINEYLSPYLNNVLGTTMQAQDRQNAIQRNALTGDAIKAGAYGGDRAGIAQANLAYDQNLANSQTIANILNQGYGQAVQTAQGQQGVQASDLQRMLAAGAQFGQLGSGATQTQLQAGQALMGAGTLGQQTDQAGLSALYNQFLQERGYPFQVAQFLANIAMGTGALSGSTTTTTQPVPFFSDARLKEDIAPVGETYDGQQIYKYRMKGDPRPQLGLMAQEVEERRPDAVGLAAGFRTLDYDRATEEAAQMGREGGLAPRRAYAPGGAIAPDDIRMLLEAQKQSFGPFAQAGLYGGDPQQGGAGKPGYVPQASLPVGKLMTAGRAPDPQRSMASEAMRSVDQISDFGKKASDLWDGAQGLWDGRPEVRDAKGNVTQTARAGLKSYLPGKEEEEKRRAYGGGVVPAYAMGGGVDDEDEAQPISAYRTPGPGIDIPDEQSKNKLPEPGRPPNAPKSVFSDIMDGAKFAASIYAMSDRRLKDNIDPVGETYDGQNIYRYDMGDGRTQLGLMAQEVLDRHPEAVGQRGGYLTLDYDRATQEAVPRAYGGGLVPRQGYREGGGPSFDEALDRTLRYEGGYNPDDVGSPTMMGIRQASNPDVDLRRVKEDPTYRSSIYKERYWKPIGADDMDPRLATVAFDTSVNLGPGRTRQLLQQAGGDPVKLLQLRQSHYDNLIAKNPETYGRYANGWNSRVKDLMSYAGGVAGPAQGAIASAAPASGGLGGGAPQGRQQPPQSQPGRKEQGFFESITPNTFRGDTQSPGQFLSSKQFWVPLLSGLGAMASSNSLFAGSAALQGLGAAAQAYSNLEKREAEIDEARARTTNTLVPASREPLVGTIGPDNKPVYRMRTDYMPGFEGAGADGGRSPLQIAQQQTIEQGQRAADGDLGKKDAITTDATGGRYNFSVSPQSSVDQQFAAYGFRGDPARDPVAVRAYIGLNPELAAKAKEDQARAQERSAAGSDVDRQRLETNLLVDAVFGISPTGVAGQGPLQAERAGALALYEWATRNLGLPGLSSGEQQNITSAQIIEKIRQQMGPALAGQQGFRGQALAQAINNAQISGSLTTEASIRLGASLYVTQQMMQDFARYYDAYVKRYGTALNVEQNFSREMAGRYDAEKTLVEQAIRPVQRDGKWTSWATELRKNPSLAAEFDRRFQMPGLARIFLGG
jgi:hypothetical protein